MAEEVGQLLGIEDKNIPQDKDLFDYKKKKIVAKTQK